MGHWNMVDNGIQLSVIDSTFRSCRVKRDVRDTRNPRDERNFMVAGLCVQHLPDK